uniref:Uncharacterized protein n=1 Tax=Octopus bimaculoides TaxID=37653 RepID=A0A0L8I0P3_OCTBM
MPTQKSVYLWQNILALVVAFTVFTLVFSFPRSQHRRFQINTSWQQQQRQAIPRMDDTFFLFLLLLFCQWCISFIYSVRSSEEILAPVLIKLDV